MCWPIPSLACVIAEVFSSNFASYCHYSCTPLILTPLSSSAGSPLCCCFQTWPADPIVLLSHLLPLCLRDALRPQPRRRNEGARRRPPEQAAERRSARNASRLSSSWKGWRARSGKEGEREPSTTSTPSSKRGKQRGGIEEEEESQSVFSVFSSGRTERPSY